MGGGRCNINGGGIQKFKSTSVPKTSKCFSLPQISHFWDNSASFHLYSFIEVCLRLAT